MIINAGITRIVVRAGYPDKLAVEILDEAGLEVEILEEVGSEVEILDEAGSEVKLP